MTEVYGLAVILVICVIGGGGSFFGLKFKISFLAIANWTASAIHSVVNFGLIRMGFVILTLPPNLFAAFRSKLAWGKRTIFFVMPLFC